MLKRRADGWGLMEVKSGISVMPHHLDDIAFQAKVLANAGVTLWSIDIIHVDNSYVCGAGEIDWTAFFARVDVMATVARLGPDLTSQFQALAEDVEPTIAPGRHCSMPYPCEFRDRCTVGRPED